MTDSRTPRTLLIPDHLWRAFEAMAGEMGTDREGLVSQALFTFARLNGFLIPGDLARMGLVSAPAEAPHPARGAAAPPPVARAAPAPISRPFADPEPEPEPTPEPLPDAEPEPVAPPPPRPARPLANADRVAELERQLQDSAPDLRAQSAPPAVDNPFLSTAPTMGGAGIEVDDSLLGDDGIHATSMDLPNLVAMGVVSSEPGSRKITQAAGDRPQELEVTPSPGDSPSRVLVLLADGRELDRVTKDRFLIGRGKHCDLIINSGKVSREHAAITREGTDYFIEDLGSSNGTWYDKRRISKRQIQEGDEYFICAEKLGCSFR